MTVSLYMDHHVPKAITVGLRLRGVDVITAYEDGTDQFGNDLLLERAHSVKRLYFYARRRSVGRSCEMSTQRKIFFGSDLWASTASDDWYLY